MLSFSIKNPGPENLALACPKRILDLRMQIVDLKHSTSPLGLYAPQSAIYNLKLGTRPKGGVRKTNHKSYIDWPSENPATNGR
jgi:hypothetical protein